MFKMDVQAEVESLKKVLETLLEEKEEMKREISELRRMCTQGERVHQSEMLAIKKDVERLKKTQPDSGNSGTAGNQPSSPDIYARMKGMKKRPQSMHEVSILPPNLQEQLQDKTQQNGSSHPVFLGPVPPYYFTLDNFEHYKKNSLKWFSNPFYSHSFGYKFCVEVDAGGSSVGEKTHVSLLIYLLPGEYDETLKWPFRGTLKIEILNERRDHDNNYESLIEFTEDTPLISSAQVTSSDRSTGWGNPLFIEYSKLAYDANTNRELLKHNQLRFVIREVDLA